MSCEQIVGVKNIFIVFTNCDTKQVTPPISHKLAKDELPKWRLFDKTYEKLPGGYAKMRQAQYECDMNIIRDLRMPLADYQGRSQLDIQIEMENGLVYTGKVGTFTGDELSDTHEVMLKVVFKLATELLPPGQLMAA